MKAIKVKSIYSQIKKTNTRLSFVVKEESGSKSTIPTPKDFNSFLPWICLQLEVPRIVTVKRLNEEEYVPHERRSSATRSKLKTYSNKPPENDSKESIISSSATNITTNTDTNAIPVSTYYNTKGHLVEVAFINCPCNINRKVMKAINICFPFHPVFHRFTIKGGGLTQTVLYEIAKLLPYSNITDICLDACLLQHQDICLDVAEGNYYLILEKESHLQNFSLRRCKINDDICIRIANNLDYGTPSSKIPLTLDLTSNLITDTGAEALGKILRKNRTLLHLNLADNKITDTGAGYILDSLHLFPLNDDDIYDLRQRYLKYCIKKLDVYKQCENEITNRLKEKERKNHQTSPRKLTEIPNYRTCIKYTNHDALFIELPLINEVEKKAKEIVGEFKDVFDNRNVRYKHGEMHAIGNLRLCSLNLAYNQLDYHSVRKVYQVLKYQRELPKPAQCKGLLRIVLAGNNIPKVCDELEAIEMFLDTAISVSLSEMSHNMSSLKSLRRLHRK